MGGEICHFKLPISHNNVVGENTVLQLNILETGVLTVVVQNSFPTRLRLVGDELWTTCVKTPVSKMFRWRTYNSLTQFHNHHLIGSVSFLPVFNLSGGNIQVKCPLHVKPPMFILLVPMVFWYASVLALMLSIIGHNTVERFCWILVNNGSILYNIIYEENVTIYGGWYAQSAATSYIDRNEHGNLYYVSSFLKTYTSLKWTYIYTCNYGKGNYSIFEWWFDIRFK